MNAREAARIRGEADRIALRLAHHDEAQHFRLRPSDSRAAQVFEAVEQARIEAIGSNALGGVRENLTAALEQRLERQGLTRPSTAEPPIGDVLALMVRERLTGQAPPDGSKATVDQIRADI